MRYFHVITNTLGLITHLTLGMLLHYFGKLYCANIAARAVMNLNHVNEGLHSRFGDLSYEFSTYYERLNILGLESLHVKRRRPKYDLLICFKIIRKMMIMHTNDFIICADSDMTTGQRYKLLKRYSSVNPSMLSCKLFM